MFDVYPVVMACQDAVVLPYAAYLRIYEPLSAFDDGVGSRWWAAYAASPHRPRRMGALAAEQAEALRRLIAVPPLPVPDRESGDAYLRWWQGTIYVCPWQTRLRSWLALARLRATTPALAKAAFPGEAAEAAARGFARWQSRESSLRVYIQASTWSVPFAWFVPFAAKERWLVLGDHGEPGEGGRSAGGGTTAAQTRMLVYATAMAHARQRVARALRVIRRAPVRRAAQFLAEGSPTVTAGLEEIGSWLEEFHPRALVELDYGGLVHLLDDGALYADQSVAEACAAVSALAAGEMEFATAMYQRFSSRWRVLAARQRAS